MHSQTHSCPNLLFHSPALVQVDAATLGNLAAVLPLQRVSGSSFPLLQPWPRPSGFIFTALVQASQLTSPPFYLVHSHQSSMQIRGKGLLKHGSYAQKHSYPPLPTAHGPGSRCGFQRQGSQHSRSISRSSPGCLGNSRPRLLTCGSQHTGVSCHCKYGTICDQQWLKY